MPGMKISRGVTPVKGECQFGFRLTAPETSEQPHSGSKGRLRFGKPSSGLRVSCPAAQNGRASTFRSSLTQQQKAGALYRARTVHLFTTLKPQGLTLNENRFPGLLETMEMRAGNGTLGMSYRAPKAGALPGCATPRHEVHYSF